MPARTLKIIIFISCISGLLISLFFVINLVSANSNKASVRDALKLKLSSTVSAAGIRIRSEKLNSASKIFNFYRKNDFQPVWISDSGININAYELLSEINKAETEGLDPFKYHAYTLPIFLAGKASNYPDSLLSAELLLTDAFITYSCDLYAGIIHSGTLNYNYSDHIKSLSYSEPLLKIAELDVRDYFRRISCPLEGYSALKKMLQRLRLFSLKGGWPKVNLERNHISFGKSDPFIANLKERLHQSGEYNGDLNSLIFDSAILKSVQLFQANNGLIMTGFPDKETIAALNIPVENRIRQVILNLERFRWLPRKKPSKYLEANIADFSLTAFQNGNSDLSMKIIVGKDYTRTPLISGAINNVVINPYWDVPSSIANKEILPILKRNPGYLKKNHMKMYSLNYPGTEISPYSIKWSDLSIVPFRIRQLPGEWNSLGRLKFIFPNPFSIYLHGTPSQYLFNERERSFSHGCIRLENPLALALWLLRQPDWDENSINRLINTGSETFIPVLNNVPIYLNYWTAWQDANGFFHFRKDIYSHDEDLASQLFGFPGITASAN